MSVADDRRPIDGETVLISGGRARAAAREAMGVETCRAARFSRVSTFSSTTRAPVILTESRAAQLHRRHDSTRAADAGRRVAAANRSTRISDAPTSPSTLAQAVSAGASTWSKWRWTGVHDRARRGRPQAVTHDRGGVRGVRRLPGGQTAPSGAKGAAGLLRRARSFGEDRVWALEDCRHVSGSSERFLIERGERVAHLEGPELDLRLLVDHRRAAASPAGGDQQRAAMASARPGDPGQLAVPRQVGSADRAPSGSRTADDARPDRP
jgi:hypothetical protein